MRFFSSPKAILFVSVVMNLIGFGIVIPLIALYGEHYGGTPAQLAILSSIYSLFQFVFAPLWGGVSDRIGRRPVILISTFGLSISYLLFGFADNIYSLIFSRALGGFFAANLSTAQAYMADITPAEKRTEAMGILGAAFGIGFVLGPPLGGFSSSYLGLHAPGIIAGSICMLNFVLALFRLPESLTEEIKIEKLKDTEPFFNKLKYIFSIKILYLLFVVLFVTTFLFSGFEQTLSLLVKKTLNIPVEQAVRKMGILLMSMGIMGIFIQGYLLKKIKKYFSDFKLLVIGLMVYSAGFLCFLICNSFNKFLIVCLITAVGSSLINPCLSGLISKNADSRTQGLTLGVGQGLGSLARTLGPMCGITLFYVDSRLPFLVACLGSICLLGYFSIGTKAGEI